MAYDNFLIESIYTPGWKRTPVNDMLPKPPIPPRNGSGHFKSCFQRQLHHWQQCLFPLIGTDKFMRGDNVRNG